LKQQNGATPPPIRRHLNDPDVAQQLLIGRAVAPFGNRLAKQGCSLKLRVTPVVLHAGRDGMRLVDNAPIALSSSRARVEWKVMHQYHSSSVRRG
jgi:hypothetical protein